MNIVVVKRLSLKLVVVKMENLRCSDGRGKPPVLIERPLCFGSLIKVSDKLKRVKH